MCRSLADCPSMLYSSCSAEVFGNNMSTTTIMLCQP
jgi:hypothetical protein